MKAYTSEDVRLSIQILRQLMFKLFGFFLLISFSSFSQNVLDGIYIRQDLFFKCSDSIDTRLAKERGSSVFHCVENRSIQSANFSKSEWFPGVHFIHFVEDTSRVAGKIFVNKKQQIHRIEYYGFEGDFIKLELYKKNQLIKEFRYDHGQITYEFSRKNKNEKFFNSINGKQHLYRVDYKHEEVSFTKFLEYIDKNGKIFKQLRVKGNGFEIGKYGKAIPSGKSIHETFKYYDNGELLYKEATITKGVEDIYYRSEEFYENGQLHFLELDDCRKKCKYEFQELDEDGFEIFDYADSLAPSEIQELFPLGSKYEYSLRKALKHLPKEHYFDHIKVKSDSLHLDFEIYEFDSLINMDKYAEKWKSKCNQSMDFHKIWIRTPKYYLILSPDRCWEQSYSKEEKLFIKALFQQ